MPNMVTYAVETGYFTKMICLKKDESQVQRINKTASWETEVVQIFILFFFWFLSFPLHFLLPEKVILALILQKLAVETFI